LIEAESTLRLHGADCHSNSVHIYFGTIDFKEIGYEVVDWIYLAQDRIQWLAYANTVTDLRAYER
jgi:hypothetical protein